MLSQLRMSGNNMNDAVCMPKPDQRWDRDMQEDMKAAIDLLFKFKASLDKLHPECTNILERMLANPQRHY